MLVAFSTTRPLGFLTLLGLYLSLLVNPWVAPGDSESFAYLNYLIFRKCIPLDSFVLKWQLEAAR